MRYIQEFKIKKEKKINSIINHVCLRAYVRKGREPRDSLKKSRFFLFHQKKPFMELFRKMIFKSSGEFFFGRILQNFENPPGGLVFGY